MTSDDFLDYDALFVLTGYRRPGKQVEQLRRSGIAFFVNASGHPVVPGASVEGGKQGGKRVSEWQPKWAA